MKCRLGRYSLFTNQPLLNFWRHRCATERESSQENIVDCTLTRSENLTRWVSDCSRPTISVTQSESVRLLQLVGTLCYVVSTRVCRWVWRYGVSAAADLERVLTVQTQGQHWQQNTSYDQLTTKYGCH